MPAHEQRITELEEKNKKLKKAVRELFLIVKKLNDAVAARWTVEDILNGTNIHPRISPSPEYLDIVDTNKLKDSFGIPIKSKGL